ncbi:MAG: hypothetical protein KDB27_28510 [Planctomycetales bacterium]|nr:hypothetical protein [Planctomycetales bacterium]
MGKVINLGASNSGVMSNNPYDNPTGERQKAYLHFIQTWEQLYEAKQIVETNGDFTQAAALINRRDMTTVAEIRDEVRRLWDRALELLGYIHRDVPRYWLEVNGE